MQNKNDFIKSVQMITSRMRRVIEDYQMIKEGDKIAIGLSGGKDSLSLLIGLANLRNFYSKKFEIIAITIDMGFKDFDSEFLRKICDEYNVNYIEYNTNIAEIIFDIRKEKNPCSLCANLRRGALNDIAKKNGCNKVALGHHYDDAIETFFLCLFFESRINSFMPITYLSKKDLYVIRPMIYLTEAEIKGFINKSGFSVIQNPCPANCNTKREEIKELIKNFNKINPNIKKNIFNAMKRDMKYWKVNKDLKD